MTRGESEILGQAETLFRNEKQSDAVDLLTGAVEKMPDNLLLRVRLADYLHQQGRLEEAVSLYRACALGYADHGQMAFAVALYKLLAGMSPTPLSSDDGRPLLHTLTQRYLSNPANAEDQEADESNASALARVRLFRDLSEVELEEIVQRMSPHDIPAGTMLFREGEKSSNLCILAEGFVKVTRTGQEGEQIDLARLGPGDFFGEWSFLSGEYRRHARIVAETDLLLLELGWVALEEITRQHPHVREVLESFYKKRRVDTLIARVFPALSGTERRRLADCLSREQYAKGSVIYREGDPSESMSLINQGSVEIYTSNLDGAEISLAVLTSGQYFGEGGALSGNPRTAHVRALTDTELYQISREDLVTSFMERPEILNSLQGVGAERIGDTLEKLEGSDDFGLAANLKGAGLEEESA